MQSCPKNVHTGPLIGSKTSKGPVTGQIMMTSTPPTSVHQPTVVMAGAVHLPTSQSQQILTSDCSTPLIKCKTEEFSPVSKPVFIKPELNPDLHSSTLTNPVTTSPSSSSSTNTSTSMMHTLNPITNSVIGHSHVHAAATAAVPNYSINPRLLEVETSISPARGSTGPIVSQCESTQVADQYYTPKRARVGKSMERERLMMNAAAAATFPNGQPVEASATTELIKNIKQEIKQESIVKQEVEEILSSEEEKMETETISSTATGYRVVENTRPQKKLSFSIEALVSSNDGSNKRTHNTEEDSDCCVVIKDDDNLDMESPPSTVKRRKLLQHTMIAHPKKSPPNSYKSLIKPGGFKAYLSDCSDEPLPVTMAPQKKKRRQLNRKRRRRGAVKSKKVVLKVKHRLITLPKSLRKKRRIRRRLRPKQEYVEYVDMTEDVEIKQEPEEVEEIIIAPPVEQVPEQPLTTDTNETQQSCNNAAVEPELTEIEHDEPDQNHEATNTIVEHVVDNCTAPEEKPSVIEPDTETSSTILPETGTSTPTSQMTNVDVTIDMVAKGYFSEPDIFTSISKKRIKRLQKQNSNKGHPSKSGGGGRKKDDLAKLIRTKVKNRKKMKDEESSMESKEIASDASQNTGEVTQAPETGALSGDDEELLLSEPLKVKKKKQKHSAKSKAPKKSKTSKSKSTTKKSLVVDEEEESELKDIESNEVISQDEVINNNNNNNNITKPTQQEVDDDTPLTDLLQGRKPTKLKLLKKQCDEYVVQQNVEDDDDDDLPLEDEPHYEDDQHESYWETETIPEAGKQHSKSHKRGKSRVKYGVKKRHRSHAKEPEEVIIPRKHANPKWCNGWSWLGKPFQAKVFLNSDDVPVSRTCYSGMIHQTGDVIRPRDCVLLRAGTKRNELPYVAKIAYLWENPEDGEMMISLLWYYRPEHTEQGRQPIDSPDEVFASRHKDHNSVACIEDKCYVLTFNEYCRYRRALKAIEMGVVEGPSIVPKLNRDNPRMPPPHTTPDLVMFCRRVYEFRLKRLKQPN